MEKVKEGHLSYLTADILKKVLQKYSINIQILFKWLNWIGCKLPWQPKIVKQNI